MPITQRNLGEDRDTFITRCIADMSAEYPQEQAAAICYLQLKKHRMAEDVPEIDPALLAQCLLDVQGMNPSYSGAVGMKICQARLAVGARQRNIEDGGIISPETL